MSRVSRLTLLGLVTVFGLTGCSTYVREERPAWRTQAENVCLRQGAVRDSAVIRSVNEMSGPGICGLTHPFKVTALAEGSVAINSTQTLDCPMIAALDTWLREVVQPAALARFGEKVVRVNSMGSYMCRGINNVSGAHLSEHAFGNAIDIGGFVLESGRELNIMRGFNGSDPQESAFLHEAHAGACTYFTTVLGPGYNIFHYNHFHVDLALHGSTSRGPRRYCKPVPQSGLPEPPRKDTLPDPPVIEEEMDIARAPLPEPSVGTQEFVASVPAILPTRAAATLRPGGFAPASQQRPPQPAPAQTILARAAVPPGRSRSGTPSPLISFTAPEADGPAEMTRPLARPLQPAGEASEAEAAPEATPEPDSPPTTSAAAPVEDTPAEAAPRPRARSSEGRPADWDLTSSIRRR